MDEDLRFSRRHHPLCALLQLTQLFTSLHNHLMCPGDLTCDRCYSLTRGFHISRRAWNKLGNTTRCSTTCFTNYNE
ncbi:hypothetical protein L798_12772 [Zootermopsis nevadensis]|uniref:Uncharacterized protein n=1 Tax=Zootermopsis nevadensis TaxID=136037 RepID=A0A067RPY6_ZOONE|nr:hypothetical protein L798_12772 [Zootermopsis nevadensis]